MFAIYKGVFHTLLFCRFIFIVFQKSTISHLRLPCSTNFTEKNQSLDWNDSRQGCTLYVCICHNCHMPQWIFMVSSKNFKTTFWEINLICQPNFMNDFKSSSFHHLIRNIRIWFAQNFNNDFFFKSWFFHQRNKHNTRIWFKIKENF